MDMIIELQKMVINSKCDSLELLRATYSISRKLGLSDFSEWTLCELNGYNEQEKLPQYRKVYGELKGCNLETHCWMPVIFGDNELEERFSKHEVRDAIPSLLEVLNGKESTYARLKLPSSVNLFLGTYTSCCTEFELQIPLSNIKNIIEQVKNNILEWSLLLEENGILGENLKFTLQEKEAVSKEERIINYVSNFYGNVDRSKIQQGTVNSEIV